MLLCANVILGRIRSDAARISLKYLTDKFIFFLFVEQICLPSKLKVVDETNDPDAMRDRQCLFTGEFFEEIILLFRLCNVHHSKGCISKYKSVFAIRIFGYLLFEN